MLLALSLIVANTPACFSAYVSEPYYVQLLHSQRYVNIPPGNILVFHESVQVLYADVPKPNKRHRWSREQTNKRSLFLKVKVDGISQRTQGKETEIPQWDEVFPL